jgi:hypothetical protein
MLDYMFQYYNFFNSFDIIFLFYNLNTVFVILHSIILYKTISSKYLVNMDVIVFISKLLTLTYL